MILRSLLIVATPKEHLAEDARQTATHHDTAIDCNRLQQMAIDCNRWQQAATDGNRLRQEGFDVFT